MLGLTRADQKWLWAARGKHPSASDYFSIGTDFPIVTEFSEWIKRGYAALAEKDKPARALRSWRFWARGTQKNDLVCGLLRDSHDTIGRPYPLLVVGTGPMPSWEKNWESLPAACEKTWHQLEYVTTQKICDLKTLGIEILKTRPPVVELTDINDVKGNLSDVVTLSQEHAPVLERLRRQIACELSDDAGRVAVNPGKSCDSYTMIMYISHVLKERLQASPNAVFMGGTFDESWMVYFRRPMKNTDFTTLWTSGAVNGKAENTVGVEGLDQR